MKDRSAAALRWCLWVVLVACQSSVLEPPDATTPSSPTPLPTDSVLSCDGAADGTECGEPGRGWHCVFIVCARNVCGDTVIADEEQCDDGNDVSGDGCSRRCEIDAAPAMAICRNGVLDPGEECDDGNRTHDDACSNDCRINACSNVRLDPGEECDDGNAVDDDACSNACTLNVCGNQRVDPGETCDGDVVDGLACNRDCSGRGVDECVACMGERCAESYSYDVFTSCRVAVNPDQVGNPLQGFVDKCTALDDCVRRNGCYDPSLGILPCYCGAGVASDQCQAGLEVRGACITETERATACVANDSNCVLSLLLDLTLPSGFANYLAECRAIECSDACE